MSESIKLFARTFVAATHWTGQVAFDCIDTHDGLMAIECNPRTTSGIHAFTDGETFVAAIEGAGTAMPDDTPLQIVPAMWLYGLPAAIKNGGLKAWWANYTAARSAFAFAGIHPVSSLLCFGEILLSAVRRKQSVADATTFEIEWNATQKTR